MEEKSIKLTKEQFLTLAKMVYAGDWLLTATRVEYEKRHEEYRKMFYFIIENIAKEFGYDDLLATNEYGEEKIHLMIEQDIKFYDTDVFMEELVDYLTDKDFANKYSEKERNNMSSEDYFREKAKLEEKYENEFCKNGIKNLFVKFDK